MDRTLAIVLAGGIGSRLAPLTDNRSKPAVPFGGKYRIIDFTLANCLDSGLRRILVLTQYNSLSLQKHLRDGWSIFNSELNEYITSVPPQMRTGESWYVGTADSVYQNLDLIQRSGVERILILSGDHIYRMDYAAMLRSHQTRDADVTIACLPVAMQEASSFGILELDTDYCAVSFSEKPTSPKQLPGQEGFAMASMGVYVFSRDLLVEALTEDHRSDESTHDFGKDIIPWLLRHKHICAYAFGNEAGRVSADNYWRDVGTLDAYYQANMDLLQPVPPLDMYQTDWPIRTYQSQYPPARTTPGLSGAEGSFINSIAAGGVIIAGGTVRHSVLFPRVFVGDQAQVENALLFNEVSIGNGAQVRNCIIDKHVLVPPGEQVGYNLERDRERFTLSDQGIVVIPENYSFY